VNVPSGRLACWALMASLSLPLLSLPLFALGMWDKAEPLQVGLHAGATLAAVATALALWRDGANAMAKVAHPFVLLPLSLGLWSALGAPFTQQPMLSLLGAPQSGFGALWFLDLAAFCAAARLARDDTKGWHALGWSILAVSAAVVLLKAWDWYSLKRDATHLLIFVAAYYGWLALAVPAAASSTPRLLTLAVATGLAVVSQSATAIGLLILMLGCALAGRHGPQWFRDACASARWGSAAVAVAAILPLAALQWLTPLHAKESLRDRHLVQQLLESAQGADRSVAGWFWGHGWGRSQDAFQSWLTIAGERLWSPTWIFLKSDYFHSHNWLLETLYAVGVPGLALAFAGFVAIPACAPRPQRPLALGFALALCLFHGVWFQLCLSLPVMALALAALADDRHPRRLPPPRLAALAACALAMAATAAAFMLLRTGLEENRVKTAWLATPPQAAILAADFRGSDLAAAELIRDAHSDFARRAAHGEATAPLATAIQAQLQDIDRRAANTLSPLLLTTGLGAMNAIHVTGELSFAADDRQWLLWKRWLDRLWVVAPRRSDQAIGYFTALLTRHRTDELARESDALLARLPDDPVGLYYRGVTLVLRPEPPLKEQGFAMLRRSVALGLERYMPVSPQLLTAIGER